MSEVNLEFQLGASWEIDFESAEDLAAATVSFILSQDDALYTQISSNSPTSIVINSPATTGAVLLDPEEQVDLSPGVWNYEIRAEWSGAGVTVLQFGKVSVLASLFAWPPVSG